MATDPFAEFGGQATQDDPFAEFGGAAMVATPAPTREAPPLVAEPYRDLATGAEVKAERQFASPPPDMLGDDDMSPAAGLRRIGRQKWLDDETDRLLENGVGSFERPPWEHLAVRPEEAQQLRAAAHRHRMALAEWDRKKWRYGAAASAEAAVRVPATLAGAGLAGLVTAPSGPGALAAAAAGGALGNAAVEYPAQKLGNLIRGEPADFDWARGGVNTALAAVPMARLAPGSAVWKNTLAGAGLGGAQGGAGGLAEALLKGEPVDLRQVGIETLAGLVGGAAAGGAMGHAQNQALKRTLGEFWAAASGKKFETPDAAFSDLKQRVEAMRNERAARDAARAKAAAADAPADAPPPTAAPTAEARMEPNFEPPVVQPQPINDVNGLATASGAAGGRRQPPAVQLSGELAIRTEGDVPYALSRRPTSDEFLRFQEANRAAGRRLGARTDLALPAPAEDEPAPAGGEARPLPALTTFTVMAPDGKVPGWVQVDFLDAAGANVASHDPAQLRASGYAVPEVPAGLEDGTYAIDRDGKWVQLRRAGELKEIKVSDLPNLDTGQKPYYTAENVLREWNRLTESPTEGSWDRAARTRYADNFIRPMVARLEKTPWMTSKTVAKKGRGSDQAELTQAGLDSLREMKQYGLVQIAYDRAGEPYWALTGTPIGNRRLMLESDVDALTKAGKANTSQEWEAAFDAAFEKTPNPPPAAPAAGSQASLAEQAAAGPANQAPAGAPVKPTMAGKRGDGKGQTPKAWRPKMQPNPTGDWDILDAIAEAGGMKSRSAATKQGKRTAGGEWDYPDVFSGGPARALLHPKGHMPDELANMLGGYGFELGGDVNRMYSAIEAAVRQRARAKVAVRSEEQEQRFASEVLATEGRTAGKRTPLVLDEVPVGTTFKAGREPFRVVGVDETTGATIVDDGPRYGRQKVPPGTVVAATKGSVRQPEPPAGADDWPDMEPDPQPPPAPKAEVASSGEPPPPANPKSEIRNPQSARPGQTDIFDGGETGGDTTFNLAGGEATDFSGVTDQQAAAAEARAAAEKAQGGFDWEEMASPGARAPRGSAATVRGMRSDPPLGSRTAPEDDPAHTQLPMQAPELLELYRQLSGGQYPRVRKKLRALGGEAAGVFIYKEGKLGSGRIELRADIFDLVSKERKQELLAQAVEWARVQAELQPGINVADAIRYRFEELVKAAEKEARTKDPAWAMAVVAHELGHFADFLPDATLKRGNVLGHIGALRRYLNGFIAEHPALSGAAEPPTSTERAALRRQAERDLEAQVREIVETIRTEEPIYREVPVTAVDIMAIMRAVARDEFPGLYDWFAALDRRDKAAVLKQALKGIVDERAARFARREQTGVQVVEKQVSRKVGPEPTPEAIRARYEELLREALRERGLVSERQIREEMDAVIRWWQGVKEVPKYFRTAPERFAEVFSAWLNNPAGVAKRAPTFWRTMMAWFEARPEVFARYEAMQDAIRSGQIYRDRVIRLREMFHRSDIAQEAADVAGAKVRWPAVRDALKLLLYRQFGPIYGRVGEKPKTRVGQDVIASVKDYLYRATAWESLLRDINGRVEKPLAKANLRHDDLAEVLFHSRVAAGDRQGMANPQWWSPNTGSERLREMQAEYGPARWAALEGAAQEMRAVYAGHVVPALEIADVLDPTLLKHVRDNTLYATFSKAATFNPDEQTTIGGLLSMRYGRGVSAKIYHQIGMLGEIRSPYVAMVQKAMSLLSMAYRQRALKAVVRFMQEAEPQSIVEAEMRWTGKHWEPIDVQTPAVGTLYTLERGEVKAWYVPRAIAEMFDYGSPVEQLIVGLAHRALAWPKAILTELNPGFWPVAFAKDVVTAVVQLPRGQRMVRHIPRAWRAARATFTAADDPLAAAMLRRLMVISRADPRGEHLGHADEMTRLLLRMGQDPAMLGQVDKQIGGFLKFWNAWKRQGQTLERTVKIAGAMHIDAEFPVMPEWMKRRLVHELAGSPDFLEKGRAAPIADMAAMFYNPWLQSIRAMTLAAHTDPRGFALRFFGTVGLASVALWAVEHGLMEAMGMPDDMREMLRSIPERDKLRGLALPLAWVDKAQGKVLYLVLPFPDTLRFLNAGLRKTMQTAGGDPGAKQGLGSLASYQGQDLPGTNVLVGEARKWWEYAVQGRNPYDAFRGAGALPEDMATAREGAGELAKQSVSNLTGGIVYRHYPTQAGDTLTLTNTEKFLRAPVVSNILGRWLRVSNRGRFEEAEAQTEPMARRRAQLRMVADSLIAKRLRGEPWTPIEMALFSEEPYLAEYLVQHQANVMQRATPIDLQLLLRAKSIEERLAIVKAMEARTQKAPAR